MKNLFVLTLLFLSINCLGQFKKTTKNQPQDILNSKIGLLINIPLIANYVPFKNELVNKLTDMGYKIVIVRRMDPFSIKNKQIIEDLKNSEVKYLITYTQGLTSFGSYITSFSDNEMLYNYEEEATAYASPTDAYAVLKIMEKWLKKVQPPLSSFIYDKKTVNISIDDEAPLKIKMGYPKDLSSENVIIIKQSNFVNESTNKIFKDYPYNYQIVAYDSLSYYKEQGVQYLITCETDVEFYTRYVSDVPKKRYTSLNSSYMTDSRAKTEISITYYPIIFDIQNDAIYFKPEIKGAHYPNVYKQFIKDIVGKK